MLTFSLQNTRACGIICPFSNANIGGFVRFSNVKSNVFVRFSNNIKILRLNKNELSVTLLMNLS
jgi:hypothetical protein